MGGTGLLSEKTRSIAILTCHPLTHVGVIAHGALRCGLINRVGVVSLMIYKGSWEENVRGESGLGSGCGRWCLVDLRVKLGYKM